MHQVIFFFFFFSFSALCLFVILDNGFQTLACCCQRFKGVLQIHRSKSCWQIDSWNLRTDGSSSMWGCFKLAQAGRVQTSLNTCQQLSFFFLQIVLPIACSVINVSSALAVKKLSFHQLCFTQRNKRGIEQCSQLCVSLQWFKISLFYHPGNVLMSRVVWWFYLAYMSFPRMMEVKQLRSYVLFPQRKLPFHPQMGRGCDWILPLWWQEMLLMRPQRNWLLPRVGKFTTVPGENILAGPKHHWSSSRS